MKNENIMLRISIILLLALGATSCSEYFAQEKLKNEQKISAEKERLERIENAKRIDEENLKKSFTIQKTEKKSVIPNCTGTKGKVRVGMTKCRIPDDCIDSKRYPLFMAREVMRQLIDNLCVTTAVHPGALS